MATKKTTKKRIKKQISLTLSDEILEALEAESQRSMLKNISVVVTILVKKHLIDAKGGAA